MGFITTPSSASFLSMALVGVILLNWGVQGGDADCTVTNNSGQDIIIVPVSVSITIDVKVGATVQVPTSQQKCKLKNAASGHELGPVTLPDENVVIVDATIAGTVDVYVASLVAGILDLSVSICLSL